MKLWVGVEVYQGIVVDVHLFFSLHDAESWFYNYTGKTFGQELDEDLEETKVFELEIEDDNPSRRVNPKEVQFLNWLMNYQKSVRISTLVGKNCRR